MSASIFDHENVAAIHQSSPKLKGLPFPRDSKGPSDPIDRHLPPDRATKTQPTPVLTRFEPSIMFAMLPLGRGTSRRCPRKNRSCVEWREDVVWDGDDSMATWGLSRSRVRWRIDSETLNPGQNDGIAIALSTGDTLVGALSLADDALGKQGKCLRCIDQLSYSF